MSDSIGQVAGAVRRMQAGLVAGGWAASPLVGEFERDGIRVGFTWTMGQIRVTVWRTSEGPSLGGRWYRDLGPETGLREIEMLPTLLESGVWPVEGFRPVGAGAAA
jgi:hypothetical protein